VSERLAFDGPVPSSRAGEGVLDLIRVQARLRAPDGCPWDREQTHRTLARHLLEEVDELRAAIDEDPDQVEAELGDVLLAAVAVARLRGLDAESALRRATATFATRAERTFALAVERGLDPERLDEDELLALYREAKDDA